MSYYGVGDYYRAGDPGFLSSLGGALTGAVGGFLTGGPLGAISGAVSSFASKPRAPQGAPIIRTPGITGVAQRMVPGGATGYQVGPDGQLRKKRRRMNYANGKALNRANRRVDGFVRLAKRSLKHTNYKIVSKSAGTRRPVRISERGPGSVHVS